VTCSRCGHRAIVLWQTWEERGVCTACLYEGRGVADTVALSARLDRLFGPNELHAGHAWPIPGCPRCEEAWHV
jgi:hypothetical protein